MDCVKGEASLVFSSHIFLCFFLPAVLIGHMAVKNIQVRNGLLIIASLLFYAYGEPVYVLLLLVSVLFNYVFGLLLGKKHLKGVLALAVSLNIGLLFVFKYLDFIILQINKASSLKLSSPGLTLPIGISFYTFQALSYVIDVYRGDVEARKSFSELLLYISFFPQLIAGPIVKYHDVEKQLKNRSVDVFDIKDGMLRFTCGLGKKVLIANTMAKTADALFAFSGSEFGLLSSWVAAITYLFQIYFDFSGYSDMAIGLGRMFGFRFPENFDHPYISGSITEFWRRWHISLTSWFRDYLYIPLGGNRKGRMRTVINRYIVFMLTGFWHGANWTFLVWGLWHGSFMMLERAVKKPEKTEGKAGKNILGHVYAMLVVTLGFVIFRADTITQALHIIKAMFGFGTGGGAAYAASLEFFRPYCLFIFAIGMIGLGNLPKKVLAALKNKNEMAGEAFAMCASIAVLVLCITALAVNSYNPFIYFRF